MTVISFQVRSMKRKARKAAQKNATMETQTYRYRRIEADGEFWPAAIYLSEVNRMIQAVSTTSVGTKAVGPIFKSFLGNSIRFQEIVNMTFKGCLNMKWVLSAMLAIAGTI